MSSEDRSLKKSTAISRQQALHSSSSRGGQTQKGHCLARWRVIAGEASFSYPPLQLAGVPTLSLFLLWIDNNVCVGRLLRGGAYSTLRVVLATLHTLHAWCELPPHRSASSCCILSEIKKQMPAHESTRRHTHYTPSADLVHCPAG